MVFSCRGAPVRSEWITLGAVLHARLPGPSARGSADGAGSQQPRRSLRPWPRGSAPARGAVRRSLSQGQQAERPRALEAAPTSLRGGRGDHHDVLGRGHRRAERRSRRGGASQVGRGVPTAPGRRRVHDAHQGPWRRPDRAPGARDRARGERVLRGSHRASAVRQQLRGPHDAPGDSAALAAHGRHPEDLEAVRQGRPDDGPGLRRLRAQRDELCGERRRSQ